jgi:hypothetical protein
MVRTGICGINCSQAGELMELGRGPIDNQLAEYEKFFKLWKDADKDMPALTEAKKEHENLN